MKRGLRTPVGPDDHSIGAAEAAVTVVEYGDFECPYCAEASSGIHLMLLRYPGSVRFAFRHFPQEEVHPHALIAAEASEAAAIQGKFWPMHDRLFRRQRNLTRSDLNAVAREIKLDMAAFALAMDGHVSVSRIRAMAADGRKSGVRSTPSLFVNGRPFDVAFDLQGLYDEIDRELAALGK
jgi:protein-disulfide isomerase